MVMENIFIYVFLSCLAFCFNYIVILLKCWLTFILVSFSVKYFASRYVSLTDITQEMDC